jgi:hypothetical protein
MAKVQKTHGFSAAGSAATADILYLGVQTRIFLGKQIASLARCS